MEIPEGLPYRIRTVITNSRFVMGGFVPTLAYDDVAFSDIFDIPNGAVPLPQGIIASDHFGSTPNQRNSFVLVSSKNGPKSCI